MKLPAFRKARIWSTLRLQPELRITKTVLRLLSNRLRCTLLLAGIIEELAV